MNDFVIENEGIGSGPFLTVTLDPTKGAYFTQDDLENKLTACCLSGNNEVSKGELGARLFGKIVWVSTDFVPGTSRPLTCAVQARGVAKFRYREEPPIPGKTVKLAGHGRVIATSTGDKMHGIVIAVNTVDQTCDVWLG